MFNFFRKNNNQIESNEEIREHLERENPVLKEVVDGFFQLDFLLHSLGYLKKTESLTKMMSWWPVISILGTYSAGKSSFINYYLDYPIQETGVQAVDDKFTVICYSPEKKVRILPGFALDSDPRFPFYKISKAIDEVLPGEGAYLDSYLQLKTCPSEKLKGKVFIDSPGFDADEKRASTLRITDRIIDLSDLVLIFFDARHPEPGSMKDTLEHLVKTTVKRRDSNKFLYILNQIDVTAKEDNLEAVYASWQRALVRYGVSAGKYFCIYNPIACNVIEDPETKKRYERKRDHDLDLISKRIEDVKIERTYRLVRLLKDYVGKLKNTTLPIVSEFRDKLKKYTLILDFICYGMIFLIIQMGHLLFTDTGSGEFWIRILKGIFTSAPSFMGFLVFLLLLFGIHCAIKKKVGEILAKKFIEDVPDKEKDNYMQCFLKNIKWYAPIFRKYPMGWNEKLVNTLKKLNSDVNLFIQKLNQEYTDPSGKNYT
ncbi:dynamin family protein [Desulfothermus sp.]